MQSTEHRAVDSEQVTITNIAQQLDQDDKVKVGGIDCDGVIRGKIMSKEKFLSSLEDGFGMSSAIFAWDMHDVLYTQKNSIANEKGGHGDFIAEIDLSSYRRLPFESNIPFFLLRFKIDNVPVFADGRSIARSTTLTLANKGMRGLAGVELEFMNFQTPGQDGYESLGQRPNLASFLDANAPRALRPITGGMFGYSVSRPLMTKDYFHSIYDVAKELGCPIEGWHTESGPGVYEAALAVSSSERMADNVSIFKFLTKALGVQYNVTPCFMAKPLHGMPGSSGHIHISLTDLDGTNLFARKDKDESAPFDDVAHLSDIGRQFLAGLIDALPDIMPMVAPNVNSYKRLVENFWAPITLSWGLEDRESSIRVIAPPTCKPGATRFEIRIPGADLHPHYALSAILRAGLRGIEREMNIYLPPLSQMPGGQKPDKLPNTLELALARFQAPNSVAREIMGNEFVDYYAITREHELRAWREAVTDWEFVRYIEHV
ncbi:hypothetical protein PFICI_10805 [Pestalotiopsis fici W106-1]|uniref:Glutamine synthetase n=1 Tax=Pestalotiopsis fici (strain W106-1 / CGMCC3.15140) TaxID=1229662 RepID=W3WVQ7_PESFW|nr:uncharacterized protein PFICI_10805 [Pestalotiopsis fici W106-1]ETS76931.1 hypothetical protein PFICI_10805 [Pestalotiopsis fici W106-1]